MVRAFATTVLHYPRLDTVLMVEDCIKKSKNTLTKHALWRILPRQVQYQTLNVILEYLEKSNKITFKGNKIVWIASNVKLDEIARNGKEY